MSEENNGGQANTDPGVDGQQQAAAIEQSAADQSGAEGGQEQGQQQELAEYSDFSMPEGMELDTELLNEFKPLAKELGLDLTKAQQLVDLGSKLATKMQQQSIDGWKKQTSEWADQAKADKEIGGKDFDANLGVALAAVDKFGTPELKAILDESGFGNHPEVVKFMYRVGKAISSDTGLVNGTKPAGKNTLQLMYPTMAQ